MRCLPALAIAALLLLPGAAALAAPPLSESEVRAFMATVEQAARDRDAERLGAALSADCRIELTTRIGTEERVTLLTREEYLGMLTNGFAALKDLEAYDYRVEDERVVLERDPPAATVVSQVTETIVFAGRRQVTRSEETARVERRGASLKVVAVAAVTTGS
jgi:hypothetical protein